MEQKRGMNFYEYHNARKASAYLKVIHPEGLDIYFSKMFSDFVITQLPTVEVLYKGERHHIFSAETMKGLNVPHGDKIEIFVIGPDAEEVLSAIAFLKDKDDKRYFDDPDMKTSKSRPNGTPFLGVSAAAYIIAYMAIRDDLVIFFDR
jgi:phosphotransferase system HPr-like phosphotransfer protein